MDVWDAMERENHHHNHVAERGLVPVNGGGGGDVHDDHGGAKVMDGFVRRGHSWYQE